MAREIKRTKYGKEYTAKHDPWKPGKPGRPPKGVSYRPKTKKYGTWKPGGRGRPPKHHTGNHEKATFHGKHNGKHVIITGTIKYK